MREAGNSRRESLKVRSKAAGGGKKAGFRPYMAKVTIESTDELQTSSTDLGDTTDRSNDNVNDDLAELAKSHLRQKSKSTKEREARRQKRLDMLQEVVFELVSLKFKLCFRKL